MGALVSYQTPAQTTHRIEKQTGVKAEDVEVDLGAVKHSLVAGLINRKWMRNKTARNWIDRRLLSCLRARKGVYSAEELTAIQASGAASTVYMKLAETKSRAAAAWMREVLQQPGERPVGLDPTHVPKLPEPIMREIQAEAAGRARAQAVSQFQQDQKVVDLQQFKQMSAQLAAQVEEEVKEVATQRAEKAARGMEDKVFDLMDEGDFDDAFNEFLEDFTTYPAAFLKGPFPTKKKRLAWGPAWKPVVTEETVLTWKRVSPFDLYPAPLSANLQDRDFIERLRLSPEEIYNSIGLPNYDEEAIRWVLNHHDQGRLRNWIWTDPERIRLESDTFYDWMANEDLIDALHYWGTLEGRVLQGWGVQGITDPDKHYQVDAVLVGSRVIRCAINDDPLGERPYYDASYEAMPGSIWGRAIPELCEAEQDICNAAARALVNNLGIASGPQVYVNVDRLPVGESITAMYPWKIWQIVSDPNGSGAPQGAPIGFFQPESNVEELMEVFSKFELRADDATGIPRYTYGSEQVQGAGQTAHGLSMLMGAAAKGIRRAIGEIDQRVLARSTKRTFVHVMLYDKDMSIKGDCNVVSRGASALLIKEQMQTSRMQALQLISNPIDQQIVGLKGRAEILREIFKGMHLPSTIIPNDEALDKVIKQIEEQAAAAAQQPDPAMVTAQGNQQVEMLKTQSSERIAGAKVAVAAAAAKAKNNPAGAGKFSQPLGAMQGHAQAA